MATEMRQLTGLEKASVLVMSLDASATAEVFDRLSPEEREVLGAEIVKLQHVEPEVRERVLAEASLTPALSCEERGRVGDLTPTLSCEERGQVGDLTPALSCEERGPAGWRWFSVFKRWSKRVPSPKAGPVVRGPSPEDLIRLPDETIRTVLARIPADDISLALYAASEELGKTVMRNLPPALATFVQRLLDSPEHPTVSEIESARERIVRELGALGLRGEAAIG